MGYPDSAPPDAPQTQLQAAFARLQAGYAAEPYAPVEVRLSRLAVLERLLRDHATRIEEAIRADFGHRSVHETRLLELFPCLEGIRHSRKHVRGWMRAERVPVGRWFIPGGARVLAQPLGVVGIIAPWNYPLLLAVSPLTSALAAGNRVLIKMSEYTPQFGALFAALVSGGFASDEVAVIEGDASVGAAFAALPFDHLLFTGSTQVGYSVMRAAAANLTPVTLELGGKSPAIIAPGYAIDHAAERIAVGKLMNAGQTCVAPDYVLVPRGQEMALVAALRYHVDAMYPKLDSTPDYTHIVNARHYARLSRYLDEARAAGIEPLALSSAMRDGDARSRRMPPCALLNPPGHLAVMRDEIFGPLLPVIGYDDLDAALAYVNARPRPLALYLFDHDSARVDRVLRATHAGGVTVNDTILHLAQDELPFGGVGASGIGAYHGKAGFDTFSKRKGVFLQARLNGMPLFKPPYGRRFERLVRMLMS